MSDKVFSDSTFTATAERYVDSWNEFSTQNLHMKEVEDTSNTMDLGWMLGILDPVMKALVYIVIAILLILMVVVICRQRGWLSGLFSGRKRHFNDIPTATSTTINIFGHEYDHEIAVCLSNEQYDEAIRLTYLKTLYYLHRHNAVSWTESKTATEYYYEYKNVERRPMLHELTALYLVAVYADKSERPVSKADFDQALVLNQSITKQ
ncbi:MAG: hypothetical protein MJZ27_10790 [Bacteroidales bacterium]|nr:hypothetical protein [Bacteroidales bacterium]